MPNDKTVEHVFVLRNGGGADLDIHSVNACCGSVVDFHEKRLSPGATANLKVRVNLRGSQGAVTKRIIVETNDPTHSMFELAVVGHALRLAEIEPETLNFGEVSHKISRQKDIVFHPNFPFRVEKVMSSVPEFTASFARTADGNGCRISVRTATPLPPGMTSGSIRVVPDNREYDPIEIPVIAMVSSDLVLTPSELLVVAAAGDPQPLSYRVLLCSRNGVRFKLLKIIPPDESIKVHASASDVGGYRIEIENLLPRADLHGTRFLIQTDCPGISEIVLPIRVFSESDRVKRH